MRGSTPTSPAIIRGRVGDHWRAMALEPNDSNDLGTTILVGVDAGATKTVAIAVTPDGRRVGRSEGDGANPKRHGLDVAAGRIASLAMAAAGRGAPALLFVAGAGVDRPEHARALEAALLDRLDGTRVIAANDTLAVLRAGTPDAVGLVVPVSTGGNVIGRAADGRVTDRGHGIFGGGYILGALAARAARRGAVGPDLAAAVDSADLSWHGRRPGPEAARLGAAVVDAAEAGDPLPLRLVDRWCGRIEVAVREEIDRLALGPTPVVIVYGGLLDTSPWLGVRVRAAILAGARGARIGGLDAEPVDGAVLLARDAWAGTPVAWDFVPRR
jgi:N-acetylglucosamine kinase-like BadF-type ATPase